MNINMDPNGPCLSIKSGQLSMLFVELHYFDEHDIEKLLQEKIGKAPGFFRDAPIVIDLEKYRGLAEELNLFTLIGLCRRRNMHIVGVRTASERFINAARGASLAVISPSGQKTTPVTLQSEDQESESATKTSKPKPEPKEGSCSRPKVVNRTVRSGQQIHAPDGDLIVLGAVQPGSELLAAGNIHVYGHLKGRALAGIDGDENARIFALDLEAEMASIAGQYKISEDLQNDHWRSSVEMQLQEGILVVNSLNNH